MKAEIIAIGTELVSGQSLDTNSQWLSRALGLLGISVHYHTSLGDDLAENVAAFQVAMSRADLVVTTGGLGPTQDDLTREALALVAGVELVEDAGSLEAIQAMFARRNRMMAERNRIQALFPAGSEPIPNAIGTAPGIARSVGSALFVCLPGVPSEMKRMFDDQVVGLLQARGLVIRRIVHRKINLFGKGESEVEAQALDLTARGRVPEVGITASEATIAFRISAEAPTDSEAALAIEPTAALIYERFADLIVGEGTDDVPEALTREMIRTGQTIATAESCTGGLLASLLSGVPGVTPHFRGGLVVDAVEAKVSVLGVSDEILQTHGAVSQEIAAEMARRVRLLFGSDLGLAVVGVAGPEPVDKSTPVGVVYLGIATADATHARKIEVGPEQPRAVIQRRAAKQALNWARLTLRARQSIEVKPI